MNKSIASLASDVQFWDRIIEKERARASAEELAELEKERAWARVRLSNQLDQQGGWVADAWSGRAA